MKAKTIRRLRKKISSFDKYIVLESYSLFGSFDSDLEVGTKILADSPEMAMRRYVKMEERRYKEVSALNCHWDWCYETTAEWGRVRVYNTRTRWKTYYR